MKKYFYGFLILVFAACGKSKYSAQINILDSLKIEAESARNLFNKIDTVKMISISKEAIGALAELKKYYLPDSIDLKIGGMIDYYRTFRSSGAKFNLQRIRVKKEIPYTIGQLESLLTDLKNNSLKSEDAEKFFFIEKNAAIKLLQTISYMQTEMKKTIANFDSAKVYFNRVIDSLKSDSLNLQSIRLKKHNDGTKKH